jgi:hypothetical protein
MNFIKKNKFVFSIAIIIMLIFIISSISIINIFFPNLGVSLYGHRLDDIKNLEISGNRQRDIANNLLKTKKVSEASLDIRGSIINIIFNVNSDISIDDAKNIAITTLNEFSTEEKKAYDIQFFITTSDNENSLFPLIGYKNKINTTILWSRKK